MTFGELNVGDVFSWLDPACPLSKCVVKVSATQVRWFNPFKSQGLTTVHDHNADTPVFRRAVEPDQTLDHPVDS